MRKWLAVLAILAIPAVPAMAQTTVQPNAAAEKPKTVTKVVCERVKVETTGSRLGPSQKVCKKVQVPAPNATTGAQAQPQGHSAHAH